MQLPETNNLQTEMDENITTHNALQVGESQPTSDLPVVAVAGSYTPLGSCVVSPKYQNLKAWQDRAVTPSDSTYPGRRNIFSDFVARCKGLINQIRERLICLMDV